MKAADLSRLCGQLNTPSLDFVQAMPDDEFSTTLIQRRKIKQIKARAAKNTGDAK
jgi:hypothetical protein